MSGPDTSTEGAADAAACPAAAPTLDVSHLDVTYRVRGIDRPAIRDVSFQIGPRESYGLVGESGSGKSTVALALTRYLPRNGFVSGGSISIAGQDPLKLSGTALRSLRARTVSMVYQEPGRALNPSMKAGCRSPRSSRSPGRTAQPRRTGPWRCCARSRSPTPAR